MKYLSNETAVRNLLLRVLAAWRDGDGGAFASVFAEDGDVIPFDGSHLHGREQIARTMQQLFDTVLKNTRCLAEVKALRFLRADVAVMQTLGGVVFSGETEVPHERYSIQTFISVKQKNDWHVASFQNTRIQARG